ncbi:aminotransferase class I/II-fold pyridoxal phosphate-dependent enzyme [Paraburkholderia antibiotica]|uniref:Aminotransferase class I/II-fold pyridoxal phosphate-dependent enzyme n=1 Tax=Paraburkholderia antibiotica TaxID=2728839 RepID=A0A7X9X282_9BURK|nr:aminotransferase class I/II-fold pyridoxal phosphate-dependent enzyme [Paraburkholderia antibiotica]NML29914.1 aminotransferase class I/II-fold pyridoxal phosphate-dependent enzyme [Paraburkholderia antibiotica]
MSSISHIERLRAKLLGKTGTGDAATAGGDAPAPRAAAAKVAVGPEHYDFARFPELREYTNTRWYYDKQGYEWNMFREHVGLVSAEVEVAGRKMINFSSYNYLNLSGDPRVQAAAKQAIDSYGTSTGSGRIIMGEIPVFGEFERELAEMLGVEDAVLGVSGYGTNVAAIGYIARKQDLVLYDELVHNSMLVGAKLSGARRFAFAHNDCDALERLLAEHRGSYERVLILTEGVFSMDGDIPDIPRLIDIKKRYHALLMVDEAHSMGVIGPRGRGVVDHFGLDPADIDIHYASMSKAFATVGGYIAGRRELITMLKHYAPGLGLYIASPMPANAAAGLAALRIMRDEPERARRVIDSSNYFREQARAAGLDTGFSEGSAVIPVMLPDGEKALWMAARMFDNNVFTFPMIFPVVPRDAARLRFFINSAHTREHIDRTIRLLVELKAAAPASRGLF